MESPATSSSKSDVRARIIAAAWSLAEGAPRSGLTIRSIASNAGVSPALLYTYFDGKAALVRELQKLARPRLEAKLTAAIVDADTPAEGLVRTCVAYVAFARRHRSVCEGTRDEPEPMPRASILSESFVARVGALLEAQGADAGGARLLRIAVDALVSDEWLEGRDDRDAEASRFVESYVRMLLRGVASPAA